MQLIKLNATDSTNNYLKQLILERTLDDFSVVVANHQTNGRGQRGSSWLSEKDKNLTFSVLKRNISIVANQQFLLNILVSLSIVKTLEGFNIPKLAIKWPNDILSDHHKISGILIENLIKNKQIEYAIIGIGLNVNQVKFEGLSKVSSLKNIMPLPVDKDELLTKIIDKLKMYFKLYSENGSEFLNSEYESYLFRKDKPSTFISHDNNLFTGIIRGVSTSGKLCVQMEDFNKEFDLKELKLIY
jgi:BirA family biotin operon repressor/biotin-[acetyl-CoA-carboxylase] ligase|tara:strand:- start:170 stop:898 length:729 start_codon:yes stop_codon:yes gene_type:complete